MMNLKSVLLLVLLLLIFGGRGMDARTFEEMKEEGFVSIGCKDSFRPFGFIDRNGKWVGFDIDIARSLSQRLQREFGLKTRWVKINKSSDRISFLKNGTVDIVIASFSITPARKKEIAFSKPYFLNEGLVILTHKKRDDIRKIQDLAGKKVVVTGRSTGERYLLEHVKGVQLIPVANDDFAHDMLVKGKCDAYFQDKSVCDYHVNHNLDLKIVGKPVTVGDFKDYYGIGFSKQAPELKAFCNAYIDELKENGKQDGFLKFWFSYEGVKVEKLDKVLSFLQAVSYKLAIPKEGQEANLASGLLQNFILSLKRKNYDDLLKMGTGHRKEIFLNNGLKIREAVILKQNETLIELIDVHEEHYTIPWSSILFIK